MILSQVLTAVILGVTAGAIPGPVLLLAFSETLREPNQKLLVTLRYAYIAGLTELFIGLFLILSSSFVSIPDFVFPTLSIMGGFLLIYLSLQTRQAYRGLQKDEKLEQLPVMAVAALMLLNGPVWLFWLSVNLPNAFLMKGSMYLGEYLFIAVYETAMVCSLSVLIFLFRSCRSLFANEKLLRLFYLGLAFALAILSGSRVD